MVEGGREEGKEERRGRNSREERRKGEEREGEEREGEKIHEGRSEIGGGRGGEMIQQNPFPPMQLPLVLCVPFMG